MYIQLCLSIFFFKLDSKTYRSTVYLRIKIILFFFFGNVCVYSSEFRGVLDDGVHSADFCLEVFSDKL